MLARELPLVIRIGPYVSSRRHLCHIGTNVATWGCNHCQIGMNLAPSGGPSGGPRLFSTYAHMRMDPWLAWNLRRWGWGVLYLGRYWGARSVPRVRKNHANWTPGGAPQGECGAGDPPNPPLRPQKIPVHSLGVCMKQGTLILVEWLDASVDTADSTSDPLDHDSANQDAQTLGFFVKLGKENLILAQECFPHASSPYRTVSRIPRILVKSVRSLSLGRRDSSMVRAASSSSTASGKSTSGSPSPTTQPSQSSNASSGGQSGSNATSPNQRTKRRGSGPSKASKRAKGF